MAEADPEVPPAAKPRRRRYEGPERRQHLDSHGGAFAGLPIWARILATVGIPGAIAFFLVWIGAQTLPAIQAELTSYRTQVERNHQLYQQQATQAEQTYRLLQRICSNVAKTDEERQRCFDR